jgi:hypothetical protein
MEELDHELGAYLKEHFGPFVCEVSKAVTDDRVCDICRRRLTKAERYIFAKSKVAPEKDGLVVCFKGWCLKSLVGSKEAAHLSFGAIASTSLVSKDVDALRSEVAAELALMKIESDPEYRKKFEEDCKIAVAMSTVYLSSKIGSDKWSFRTIVGIIGQWQEAKVLTRIQLDTLNKYNQSCRHSMEMEEL